MRRAARVDTNQAELVELWRGLHCSIGHLHTIGSGFPDLVLGAPGLTVVSRQLDSAVIDFVLNKMGITQYAIHTGCNLLVEVKDGSKPLSRQHLTPDEEQWHSTWKGQKCIVASEEAARRIVGIE